MKAFLSIQLITLTLFLIVFAKMERVRMSYVLHQQNKVVKKKKDQLSFLSIKYAEVTRLDRVRYLALTQLSLGKAQKGQVIQMAGDRIIVAH